MQLQYTYKLIVLSLCLLGAALTLLFAYGVFIENLCLVTSYAVFSVIATITLTGLSLIAPWIWPEAIFLATLSIFAQLHVLDLGRARHEQQQQVILRNRRRSTLPAI